eukprot:TRINITY_DN61241_c0_g1_i1.p1 TRINITY_DN61241_c0_g1~~TRINITY_DN61241_c0_g1_i1.p1  ORF type:complete len:774 (-),score=176.03 TRINITY_DN61241_c0_g1_i1:101-2422(-)
MTLQLPWPEGQAVLGRCGHVPCLVTTRVAARPCRQSRAAAKEIDGPLPWYGVLAASGVAALVWLPRRQQSTRSRSCVSVLCAEALVGQNGVSMEDLLEPDAAEAAAAAPADGVPGDLTECLQRYFKFEGFRLGQQEVIEAVLAGRDVEIYWATSAGKSLCYQLPAIATGKIAIIASPLISLMFDQVTQFNRKMSAPGQPKACLLGSAQETADMERRALAGEFTLVYVTPEKLTSNLLDGFRDLYDQGRIALLAVDEAERITQWGHDFRPAFRDLGWFREEYPDVPILAVSGAAPKQLQADIRQQLRLENAFISKLPLERRNLHIRVSRKNSLIADMDRIASEIANSGANGGSTLVYVPTKPRAKVIGYELQKRLEEYDIRVGIYHGETSDSERKEVHLGFLSGEITVVVATIAYGMGIDKPDIRRVYQYGSPKSILDFYQQIGRAGRDGNYSTCEVLVQPEDWALYMQPFFTDGLRHWPEEEVAWHFDSMEKLRQLLVGNDCRHRKLVEYFGETPSWDHKCGACDVCDNTASSRSGGREVMMDFTREALLVLDAVTSTMKILKEPQTDLTILKIVQGSWEGPRLEPMSSRMLAATTELAASFKKLGKGRKNQKFLQEIIKSLCNEGYLDRKVLHYIPPGGCNQQKVKVTYLYKLSSKGVDAQKWRFGIQLPFSRRLRVSCKQESRLVSKRVEEVTSNIREELEIAGATLENFPPEDHRELLEHVDALWKLLKKRATHLKREVAKEGMPVAAAKLPKARRNSARKATAAKRGPK